MYASYAKLRALPLTFIRAWDIPFARIDAGWVTLKRSRRFRNGQYWLLVRGVSCLIALVLLVLAMVLMVIHVSERCTKMLRLVLFFGPVAFFAWLCSAMPEAQARDRVLARAEKEKAQAEKDMVR